MQPGMPPKMAIPGVKYLIAIASGKGGVGKSTVAANLALALKMHGQAVGLMDADIYGPSVPTMMGLDLIDQSTTPFPVEKYGIKLMSMGFLVDQNQAVIWRPKGRSSCRGIPRPNQLGNARFLDHRLAARHWQCAINFNPAGAVDGRGYRDDASRYQLGQCAKGLKMFNEVRVPVIGVIENMSFFVGDDGKRYEIFRHGGGQKLALEAGVPLLGEIPIDPQIAECGDAGEPIVSKYPSSPVTAAYLKLALVVMDGSRNGAMQAGLPEVQL